MLRCAQHDRTTWVHVSEQRASMAILDEEAENTPRACFDKLSMLSPLLWWSLIRDSYLVKVYSLR
jgi:hypothetical protein